MKLREWFKGRSTQEWMMIGVIAMLLIMILTRWGYITHHAGDAFRRRFIPPDSLITPKAAPETMPATENLPEE